MTKISHYLSCLLSLLLISNTRMAFADEAAWNTLLKTGATAEEHCVVG